MLSHHLLACRKRKAVVLALRGTMSMADIVTDAVAHPEQIDDWLPPHFAKVCWFSRAVFLCPPRRMRTSSLCGYILRRSGISHAFPRSHGPGA